MKDSVALIIPQSATYNPQMALPPATVGGTDKADSGGDFFKLSNSLWPDDLGGLTVFGAFH
jgi:hypothetical protein